MMNLTSSKDFAKLLKDKSDSEYRRLRENFDNFLEKPLKLGYFIPCDENDVPLEEPKRWKDYLDFPESFDGNKEWYELYAYQEAKQRVLFEGFEYDVMLGATQTIEKWKPVVQVEMVYGQPHRFGHSVHDILKFFEERGYKMTLCDGTILPMEWVQKRQGKEMPVKGKMDRFFVHLFFAKQ